MAQTRLIQDLVELVTPNNNDVFVIVDNTTNPSLSVAKKISYASLKEDLQDMIDVLVSGDTSIDASYNDASNTITLSVNADTTVQKGIVSTGGTNVGTRRELNFIAGSGITLSGVDNSGSNRVDLNVTVNPSEIKITDLDTSTPLPVVLGGTAATTAGSARVNLGAAKLGANSDITSLSGLTTPLSVSQGGTGGDTAQEALRNIGGLKYITNVGVAGESLIVNQSTLVSDEYRSELKGIKAGSSKVSVGTDAGDISVDVNADDVLSAASQNANLNGYRITNLGAPIGSSDAVNRAYVDQVGAGLSVKEAVIAATTASIASTYSGAPSLTLTVTGTGTPSFDGISIATTGTRVLIKDQATASENGIYTLTTAANTGVSAVFTRATDYDASAEVGAGTFVFVQSGTTNGSKQFVQTTSLPTLDSSPLVYTVLNDTTIADNSVTNAKLEDMAALTIKGAVASGDPHDLTPNEVISIVSSGSSRLPSKVLELGSTTATGVVRLYDGIDSTSTSVAATAASVKTAYDLANGAMPKSGGTFTGAVSGVTASTGNNSTQLATTAFVNNEIANDAPTKSGGGAFGTWNIDISGNASSATVLQNARTISLAGDLSGNVSFNGGSDVTITGVVADDSHNHIIGNVDGLQTALDAKAPITNPTFIGTPSAPTPPAGNSTTLLATTAFVANAISGVTGGAVTSANKLTTARTIALGGDVAGSVSFDGSSDVTIATTVQANSVALGTDTTGSYVAQGATAGNGLSGSVNSESGTFTVTSNATQLNTANTIVYRDNSGDFSAGTITANLAGNASTADALSTGRTISLAGDLSGSVSFDGSTNVTLNASVADDSHNHTIGNVDGLQAALNAKAPLVSPALTGTPTAPTAAVGANTTQVATTAFVSTAVANLVDTAPAALNTLNELAAALGDDPNFATTVSNQIGAKLDAAAYTASDVLAKIVTVDGSTSGLDADLLDGQEGSYYRNASNINAGTIGDAYLPATISSNITGNAATATRLATTRTIALGGDLVGSTSFDGSSNVTITASVADDSHNHIIGNVDGLQAALDAKASLASPVLTGAPTAPTATTGANTTQLATTAFVQTAVANKLIGGTVTVASASKTLVADEFCTVINSGLTITLPSSPSPSDTVGVSIAGAFTDTTIARNGEAIMGLAENLTVNKGNLSVMLKYVDATRGWRII